MADHNEEKYTGLPIESLISAPVIAAAKAEQELTAVYIDRIKKLAYASDAGGKPVGEIDEIILKTKHPVQKGDNVAAQDCEMHALVSSLVPVPEFNTEELGVEFDMEVKPSTSEISNTKGDASGTGKKQEPDPQNPQNSQEQ